MDHKSKEADILKVLKEKWHLRKPGLLISVIGAASDVEELKNGYKRETFFGDIIKAAKSTSKWVYRVNYYC